MLFNFVMDIKMENGNKTKISRQKKQQFNRGYYSMITNYLVLAQPDYELRI